MWKWLRSLFDQLETFGAAGHKRGNARAKVAYEMRDLPVRIVDRLHLQRALNKLADTVKSALVGSSEVCQDQAVGVVGSEGRRGVGVYGRPQRLVQADRRGA